MTTPRAPPPSPTDALPSMALPFSFQAPPRSANLEPKIIHHVDLTPPKKRQSPGKVSRSGPIRSSIGKQSSAGHFVRLSASSPTQGNKARALLDASSEAATEKRFLEAISNGDMDEFVRLLGEGADVDSADNKGRAAVHFASVAGHTDILQILLEQGANRDAQDVNGNTPLHLAVSSNRIDCVRMLLNVGADPSIPDRFLRTPLQLVQGRLRILTDPDFCNQAPDNLLAEVKQLVGMLAICTSQSTSTLEAMRSTSINPDALAERLASLSTADGTDTSLSSIFAEVQQMLNVLDLGAK
ncbi:hypothetical protein HK097_001539 [Rhizophlyctis rosea]|uniref:Uncharacterized protein n=1 Tax=Rhizophlyctis rosea TaxID=64517 RepID=A0AAD5WYA6_9FUNG|nr:hypothetical protein HK097_001539 [Rhizophlyctis rosea]